MNVAMRAGMTRADFLSWEETLSIVRYVTVAQDSLGLTVYERRGEDWLATTLTDPAAILHMPEIGVSLPLIDLYAGVLSA